MNINSYYSTELLVRERTNDLLRTAERRRLLREVRLARKAGRKAAAALRRTKGTVVQAVVPAQSTERLKPLDTNPSAAPARTRAGSATLVSPRPAEASTVVQDAASVGCDAAAQAPVERQHQPVG